MQSFNEKDDKWTRGMNMWRKDLAKAAKRAHKFPDLWEWLHWTQAQYYGQNKRGMGDPEAASQLAALLLVFVFVVFGFERWSRNIAVALGNAPTSEEVVSALEARRTDSSELVREHVEWALSRHRVAGTDTAGRFEEVVEPYLLRAGLLARTSRGRMATPAAFEHLGIEPPLPGSATRSGATTAAPGSAIRGQSPTLFS